MRTKALTILIGFIACLLPANAITVNEIMSRAVKATTGTGNLTATFAISSPSGNGPVKGNIAVSGSKFAFTSPQTSIIFNGETQWTVDNEAKEVSIYNPDTDEIQQVNPFAIIRNHQSLYKSRLISSSNGLYKIELTPKDSAQSMSKIMLTLTAADYMPASIVLHLSDGNIINVEVTGIRTGVNIPSSRFVFNKGNYPGYEIIDLR